MPTATNTPANPSADGTSQSNINSSDHRGTDVSNSSEAQDTRTEAQKAADELYEQNIELEYEKREGGA